MFQLQPPYAVMRCVQPARGTPPPGAPPPQNAATPQHRWLAWVLVWRQRCG
ncbi:hypothetical protein [Nitrosomonas communis]|uniref:hypothetical protein n=1 Tax=Nitrosomonas communis TaxID=44574 RepID=UPI0015A72653|nr:hypothetical protein [Nitrosomonas communis]